MSQELLSVEQVAARLGLHVRTVRAYVRDGRLKALKLGKSYRIARADLEALAGPAAVASSRTVEVSSIVEVEDLTPDEAMSLANAVVAAANTRGGEGPALRAETLYDPARRRMKLVLIGDLATTTGLLKLVAVWLEGRR